ncbi:hypothetical protein [Roseovarius sp. SYSU LYC5161]
MPPCPASGATGVTATPWPELDAPETEGLRASAELLKWMVEAV